MRFGCDVVLLMAKLWVLKGGELIVMKLLQNCMMFRDLTLHLLSKQSAKAIFCAHIQDISFPKLHLKISKHKKKFHEISRTLPTLLAL